MKDCKTQFASALSLTAARTLVTATAPVEPVRLALADAAGCVAAADVHVPHPLPPMALALRAGWAVASAETVGATPNAPCFPSLPPQAVVAGAALPAGADAVLPPHAVNARAGFVEVFATAMPGEGVRRVGEDFDPARVVVAAGTRLNAVRIAALRAAGIAEVLVRRPRLAIVAADATTATWFAAAAQAAGAASLVAAGWPDTGAADLVVHIGQPARDALNVRSVAVRPGETLGAGAVAGAPELPAIGVGARPEEMLAAWLLLIRPCLAALAADATPAPRATYPLTRKIVSAPGLSDLVLVRRVEAENRTRWAPLATGDIPWHAMAEAEAFLVVPAESEGHAAGEPVAAEYL